MSKKDKVSNERKNLHRLAGEFLVASRLTQRGYMVALQWGTTIGYDILVFDKQKHVAYLEVKSSASNSRRWVLQKKYASPRDDAIPADRRFVCCVDLAVTSQKSTFSQQRKWQPACNTFSLANFPTAPATISRLTLSPKAKRNCLGSKLWENILMRNHGWSAMMRWASILCQAKLRGIPRTMNIWSVPGL